MLDLRPVKKSTLVVDGTPFEALAVRGTEAIGTPFRYEIEAHAPRGAASAGALIGKAATLELVDALGARRTIAGLVAEARVRPSLAREDRVSFVLSPLVHPATLASRSTAFLDRTAPAAAADALGGSAPAPRLALTKTYEASPYRVQRGETDWDYALRTFAADGVFVWFDHDAGSVYTASDDSRGAPFVEGVPVIPFRAASELADEIERISEFAVSVAMVSSAVSTRSFSWRSPSLGLSATVGGGRYEAYDAPGGGPTTPDATARAAALGAGRASTARSNAAGLAASVRLYPGRCFTLLGSPGLALDGEWFVTSIELDSQGDDRTFLTRFTALRRDVAYVPSVPRAARQAGLSLGTVVAGGGDEVFPDASGRVRVQMHWDREGGRDHTGGTWMRVAQRGAPGSLLTPRTGWNVATLHEEGSVDAPFVVSRIHDGEHPPAYALPGNMTRVVWKTATTPGGGSFNEVHFEDAKGREEVFWNASKDFVVRTDSTKTEEIGRDAIHAVANDQRILTRDDHGEVVSRDQTVTVGTSETIRVKKGRNKEVGRDERITIGGSRNLRVGTVASLGVEKNRSVSVGAAQLDVSLGNVGHDSQLVSSVLVGGISGKVSGGSITDEASVLGFTTVGIAKVELSGTGISQQVDGTLTETVLGSVSIDAGGRYLDTSDLTSKNTIAGALAIDAAKDVRLEAADSITLKCGQSVLVVEPTKITISTSELTLDGKKLDIQTLTIEHNG